MSSNYLKLILILLAWSVVPRGMTPIGSAAKQPRVPPAVVRRIAMTARLAAEEYSLGVREGKVVLAAEIEEAHLFLAEAKKAAGTLPASEGVMAASAVDGLVALVDRLAAPDSVRAETEAMILRLTKDLGIALDEQPTEAPSSARGRAIYRARCASCHGETGAGDGPVGAGLNPKPANLSDPVALRGASPLDFYRRLTIGVAGTAMASYEATLSSSDRWAVALYASMLRLPPATGPVPPSLRGFSVTAALSDSALLASLGDGDLARVAAVRSAIGPAPADYAAIFEAVRRRLDSASDLAKSGDRDHSRGKAIDAYMSFETVERELRIKDPRLVTRLETAFAEMRDHTGDPKKLAAAHEELARALDKAEAVVGKILSPVALFAESAVILLREGLEAILVVGALIAFLAKLGASNRRREIHWGVLAAIGLSLITALLVETVFRLSPSHQEALEGATMVIATVMLFWVSYWLVSKMDVASWNRFVKSRLSDALSGRSMLALSTVAFLAVYREGFETVLFYKALAVSAGGGIVAGPILLGIAVAAVLLAIIYTAISRFGVRLPLRPFFAVTSGFLYLMAVVFAGKAVAELQEGGFLPSSPLEWVGRAPTLGLYPTIETTGAQALLIGLGLFALIWIFLVAPRHRAAPNQIPER